VDPNPLSSDPDPDPSSHVHSDPDPEPNRIRINLDPDPTKIYQKFSKSTFLLCQNVVFEREKKNFFTNKVRIFVISDKIVLLKNENSSFTP